MLEKDLLKSLGQKKHSYANIFTIIAILLLLAIFFYNQTLLTNKKDIKRINNDCQLCHNTMNKYLSFQNNNQLFFVCFTLYDILNGEELIDRNEFNKAATKYTDKSGNSIYDDLSCLYFEEIYKLNNEYYTNFDIVGGGDICNRISEFDSLISIDYQYLTFAAEFGYYNDSSLNLFTILNPGLDSLAIIIMKAQNSLHNNIEYFKSYILKWVAENPVSEYQTYKKNKMGYKSSLTKTNGYDSRQLQEKFLLCSTDQEIRDAINSYCEINCQSVNDDATSFMSLKIIFLGLDIPVNLLLLMLLPVCLCFFSLFYFYFKEEVLLSEKSNDSVDISYPDFQMWNREMRKSYFLGFNEIQIDKVIWLTFLVTPLVILLSALFVRFNFVILFQSNYGDFNGLDFYLHNKSSDLLSIGIDLIILLFAFNFFNLMPRAIYYNSNTQLDKKDFLTSKISIKLLNVFPWFNIVFLLYAFIYECELINVNYVMLFLIYAIPVFYTSNLKTYRSKLASIIGLLLNLFYLGFILVNI